ncbi:MAG: M20/M25/M40 family metallo-hydrolase [Oscillospiraceae bacterium]|nr:M20/M25/M40 family metallo-hydrolase [Oscillospiraceae bacterium]
MDSLKLFEKIEALQAEYVKMWETVCNIESPTDYKPGVDAVCDFFVKLAETKGWKTEVLQLETAGNAACITMNPDVNAPAVVFSGHMDTVHPVGSFGTPAVRITDGKIFGPGTQDCKGGIVASVLAMDALDHLGFRSRPVKLILQSDEETGSANSGGKTLSFMVQQATGAAAFLNAEAIAGKEGDTVVMERKGILRQRFTVLGKAVHAARCDLGASAVAEAAYKIIELEKMKDPEGLTCNCGVIHGGTATNSVPDSCCFETDIRYATEAQYQQALKITREIAETVYVPGCRCELTQESYRPPMEKSEKSHLLLERINEIYRQRGLPRLKTTKSAGGSDASYITAAGIPCIDSIGPRGGKMHSLDEFAYVDGLPEAAKRLACVAAFL